METSTIATLYELAEGLNRTMQYGKQKKVTKKSKSIASLNRTMQYGNAYFLIEKNKEKKSLNRTMQYGNVDATQQAEAKQKV